MGNWKILMTYTYPHEAHMVQGFLESEGIETIMQDEMTAQVNNFYSNAIGGVKILVRTTDYENGIKTLQKGGYLELENSEPKIEIEKVKLEPATNKSECPFCTSENIGKSYKPNLITVFVYFILGAIFPIFKLSYQCFDCNKKWRFVKK